MGNYAHSGETVRLLVRGQGTHSVDGTVVTAAPAWIKVRTASAPKGVKIPHTAIVSIEIQVNDGGALTWVSAALPPPLKEVLAPLGTMFLTGTGALPRDLSEAHCDKANDACSGAARALIDPAIRDLVEQLGEAVQSFRKLKSSHDYERAERAHESVLNAAREIKELSESIPDLAPIRSAADHLVGITETLWRTMVTLFDPKPRYVSDAEPARVAVSATGEAELPLRIRIDAGHAPASRIETLIEPDAAVELLTQPPIIPRLLPGQSQNAHCTIVIKHSLAVRETQLSLRAQLRYRTVNDQAITTPTQTLHFRLVPESQFETIPNPYIAYAGGTAVEDPQMFFGRTNLITDLVDQLHNGPIGMGYAVYGQKRTGKTSLVEQLRRNCTARPAIVASTSFGLLDRTNLAASLARRLLEQVRLSLLDHLDAGFDQLMQLWPSEAKIENRPIESLQSALNAGRAMLARRGWDRIRYVFLLDEFTYLFEVLRSADYSESARENVREFMRQWKALLESRTFSTVIVGQDTMPLFMQRFPNEFSSMKPLRLGYLTADETQSLANRPILDPAGRTRYTGYALEGVYGHTHGHPYFTQVLCDRIVQRANLKRKSQITELDVDDALESLVSGPDRLDPFRFDCLLTADNTGLVTMRHADGGVSEEPDPDSAYAFDVLSKLAELSGAGNRFVEVEDVISEEHDWLVVEDLVVRDVLERRSASVRIQMPLFAEYLRRT